MYINLSVSACMASEVHQILISIPSHSDFKVIQSKIEICRCTYSSTVVHI